MTQSVKYLPCKQGLSLLPQNPSEKSGEVVCAYNPGAEEVKTGGCQSGKPLPVTGPVSNKTKVNSI